jgi:hypothetical protein
MVIFDLDGWSGNSMEQMLAMGVVDWNGDGILQQGTTPGTGDLLYNTSSTNGWTATFTIWVDTTKNWEVNPMDIGLPWDRPVHTSVWPNGPCWDHMPGGGYEFDAYVYDNAGNMLASHVDNQEPLQNEPYMLPDIALDVKGSCQMFVAKNTGPWTILDEWSVHPGVNSPVVTVASGGGENDDWIEICAAVPGDAIVKAYLDMDRDGNVDEILDAEKKWGEISDSILDVHADANDDTPGDPTYPGTAGIQHTKTVTLDRYDSAGQIPAGYQSDKDVGDLIPHQEIVAEWVYADFYWGALDQIRKYLAGHAVVHFWLFDDTQLNQAYIDALMEYLEAGNSGWTAVGEYDPPDEFRIAMNTLTNNPFEYIDYLRTHDLDPSGPTDTGAADTTEWKDPEEGIPNPNAPGNETVVGTYIERMTEGDWPGEIRGRALAELRTTKRR